MDSELDIPANSDSDGGENNQEVMAEMKHGWELCHELDKDEKLEQDQDGHDPMALRPEKSLAIILLKQFSKYTFYSMSVRSPLHPPL